MSQIITPRKQAHVEKFVRSFHWRNNPNAGFGFDCDKTGNILPKSEAAETNWQKCLSGEFDVVDDGIQDYSYNYWEPAILKCDCGRRVSLEDSWANTCDCGLEYNGFGQLLAPRSQWGEETGETFAAHNWSNDY